MLTIVQYVSGSAKLVEVQRSSSALNFVSKPFFNIGIVLALYIRPTGYVGLLTDVCCSM